MDPIHPIVPVAPNIAPVTGAPLAGRVGRDSRRERDAERRRERRAHELDGDDEHGDADGEGHVDVTA